MSKAVTFDFSNYVPGKYVQSSPVYRYDAGRSIYCTGISDDITGAEVHFSAQGQEEAGAYNCIIRSGTISCDIPNEYLAQACPISVYIYVTQDGSTITTYEGRIPVIDRAEPDSYTGDADSTANGVLALVKSYANGTGGLTVYTFSGNLVTGETITREISSARLTKWLAGMTANENNTWTDSDGTVWRQVGKHSVGDRDETTDNAQYWAKQAMAAAISVESGMSDEQYQQFIESLSSMDFNGGYVDNAGYLYLTKDGAALDREDFVPFYMGASFDGGYVDENTGYLHLTKDNEEIDGFTPFYVGYGGGGGGGGGGGSVSTVVVTNTTGWLSTSISTSATCRLSVNWSSTLEGISTGAGTLSISVNGSEVLNRGVDQGDISVEVSSYLVIGTNTVRVKVSDMYGVARTLTFSIKVIDISLSAPAFNTNRVFTGPIQFTFIPNGKLEKTIHFIIDGVEQTALQMTTSASGTSITQMIPAQKSGSHRLEVYATAIVSGDETVSNRLKFEIACSDTSTNVPIITMQYDSLTVSQYSNIVITYMVYDPSSTTTTIQKFVNNKLLNTEEGVEAREYTWTYRAETVGLLTLSIACGSVIKDVTFTVTETDADIGAVTDNLQLYLSAANRSNNEQNPAVWRYDNTSASFENFNWSSDGWISDSELNTVLRVSGDDRVTIPFNIFGSDFRGTGETIEFEFSTHNVKNYNAEIISCFSDNVGLKITGQRAMLKSVGSEVSSSFKEDDHVRVSFVVEKVVGENRLIYLYLDGIMSGVVQYDASDTFTQRNPVGITIGSSECTVDIYCIRIYNNSLMGSQILRNWIADTQNSTLMLERYNHNDVYDDYGSIIIDKLPHDLPYMILTAEELPQYKGDKKTISGEYVDPVDGSNSFTFTGCQINVQGTSSAPYARKNYDMQFKNGFEMTASGEHADNYALTDTVVPFNRFVMKADVASSEGANNVQLVKLYCDLHPFKTREMVEDSRIRPGIYGFPIVIFWRNATTNEISFLGKYNFNLPKRAPGPYGYHDEMESWEFQNNTSNLMLFKTDYFDETMVMDPTTGDEKEAWRYDYEARFPSDEWVDYTKLQQLQSFIYSTDRESATNETLEEPVTYAGVEYTTDSAAYRLAKFKAEFGNYAQVNSFVFYYVFTEFFLMVDSRAKNLFIGFSGSDTDPEKVEHIDRKAVAEPYDMDTALGTGRTWSLV